MTPRQIAASLHFALKRKKRENAEALMISTLGARGKQKAIDEAFKEWTQE